MIAMLSLLISAHARAFDDKAVSAKNELISAIQAEDQSRVKPDATATGKSGIAYIRSLDQAFRQESRQQIDYSLGQIAESYRSPEVARAIDGLQTALVKDAEQRENAELARLEALTLEVTTVLKGASEPEDIDALIEKLNKLGENSPDRRSEKVAAAYQSMRPLKPFVSSWQDYLQSLKKGNRKKANQTLQNLVGSSGSIPLPRSMLIALIDETSEAGDAPDVVPAEIKELDDITPALQKMRTHSANNRMGASGLPYAESDPLVRSLGQIDRIYQNFKAGLPVSLEFITGTGDSTGIAGDETSTRLKAKLLLLILPRLVGAPDRTVAKPGENAIAFIERMIRETGERGDLDGCARAFEISQTLKRNSAGQGSLQLLRGAQSQEAAGQTVLAVISYQSALVAGCDPILAGLVGKRLEAIKRDHPDDFKRAMESLLILRK